MSVRISRETRNITAIAIAVVIAITLSVVAAVHITTAALTKTHPTKAELDDTYLSQVEEVVPVNARTIAPLVDLAESICTSLEDGASREASIQVGKINGFSTNASTVIVDSAISTYCPNGK